jgi:hypothetical protein
MKWQAKVVLILLSIIASADVRGLVQKETQVRGYWTDPSTGLMWAGKDNGSDVSCNEAMKYCRNLRLGGYSDWSLATIDRLQGIYDKDARVAGLDGKGNTTWHVKGSLFLTGDQWSSSRISDNEGHPSGYGWYFDFNSGQRIDDNRGYRHFKRALCVR